MSSRFFQMDYSEAYSKPCQTSKMEVFVRILNAPVVFGSSLAIESSEPAVQRIKVLVT